MQETDSTIRSCIITIRVNKFTGSFRRNLHFLLVKSRTVKVKCTLLQALRLCTGRTAHRGSRGIALLRLCAGRTAHRGSRGIVLLRLCTGRTVQRWSRGIALLRLCTGCTAHRGEKRYSCTEALYRPYGP
jgi:hypothetical protein